MWIAKIELTNFKCYQYQSFEFPKPDKGRNLVLIGGKNGFGKTTLLEALYLCLYGKDATHHLPRAGLKENAYARFLNRALHGKALASRRDQMRTSVGFMVDDAYGFEITRTWYFDSSGNWNEEEVLLGEFRNGVRNPLNAKEQLSDILETHVVPAHLAPFFFFDGEEVKRLADQDRAEWIRQGMEGLMGVVLVKKLRERLTQYQNNRRQGLPDVDQAKLDTMLATLNSKEAELQRVAHDLVELEEQIAHVQARRDDIQQRLLTIGAGGGDIKSVEDIVREEEDKRRDLETCEKRLEELLGDRLPFHLVHPELIASLKARLKAEDVRIEWEARKRNLEPQKAKFTEKFMSSSHLREISPEEKTLLQRALDEAWESLFWPQPEGCAESVLHTYLEPRQRQHLQEIFTAIQIGAQEIQSLLSKRAQLISRLKELETRRLKLEGLHTEGALQELNRELNKVQEELDNLNKKKGDLERQKISLKALIDQERATYERENARYIKAEPAKSVARKAGRVIQLIDELLPKLYELKVQSLSKAVTKHYRELAHKGQVARIEIQPNGLYRCFSDGEELMFDRSAGENQIFATALFAGLAEVSGYHVPLVVDTPLARLDSQHRANLLRYWTSDPNRQVILLSQDREVDEHLVRSIESHLAKTYLLETYPLGQGVYRTVAYENQYFGRQV